MTTTCTTDLPISRRTRSIPVRGLVRTILTLGKARRDLARLDPEQLRDIGVSPAEARREAARPAWDVPENWRR